VRASSQTLLTEDQGGLVRRTVLPGGLRVITEAMPTVRSVSFGVWTAVGSRDETPALAGATHYLEHLLFKGTERRDALQISAALEAVGGEVNAFTAKEYTCYYARVLDTDLALAVDVVCDLVASSLVTDQDVDAERDVVLEEIAMQDDDPSDCVHELAMQRYWPGSALGRPILGTVDSVRRLRASTIRRWYRHRYVAPNLVVAAAGNLDHATVVRLVRRALAATRLLASSDDEPAPARIGGRPPRGVNGVHLLPRPTEQANVVLTLPGLPRMDPQRFAVGVLNAALGGGMSSRLFQEVRERRGLAYSVYSFGVPFADTGLIGVYAGCQPQKVDEVLRVTRGVLADVAEHGLSAEELHRGKGHVRGSFVLGLEDTGSRMSRLGKSELVYGQLPAVGEVLADIDAVTPDDVRAVAGLLAAAPSLAVVGPFDDDERFRRAVA
jgi:predicted Zn-dependent peptidase